METLILERADGVATLTLNRPDKKNAVSGQMWRELEQVFAEVSERKEDRVLVITGAGDGFCSGQDLMDPVNAKDFNGTGGALWSMRRVGRIALSLHEMPKPTIAAVNGVAAGAGANLALGCDLIFAGESARFSQIFSKRGLNVDFGGSWILPRLVGMHKAKELVLLGDMLSAEEAERFGLVNRVVPDASLLEVVGEVAVRLAAGPPLALSMAKRALNQSFTRGMAEALETEAIAQTVAFGSRDVMEAMDAFVNKRAPEFTGE